MARLVLNLLGAFQASLDGAVLTGFDSDKTRALLVYLAVESDRPHRREALAGLLWPEVMEASARQSLSQALFNLRRVLGDAKSSTPFILATRDTVQFNRDSDYALDTDRLGDASISDPQPLISLYRAPFLDGFTIPNAEGFEAWLLLQRETMQRRAIEIFDKAANTEMAAGNFSNAIALAQRQLELDPWREEAHRQLMRAYALHGQRTDALAQFEKCKLILKDELGIAPSAETTALLEQIKADGLSSDASASRPAPPIHSGRSFVTPAQLTPFIGRERELDELAAMLADPEARLVELVGIGGMGKTRLGIELLQRAGNQFDDGVAFVPMNDLVSIELIPATIANALGIALSDSTDPAAQLLRHLRGKRMLLLLDSFEHAQATGVQLLVDILRETTAIKILVTSREALHLSSEWIYPVHGLGDDAVSLFWHTARRAQIALSPDGPEANIARRICKLVDDMPLAIEMAAAWLRTISLAEIEMEIQSNLDFLASASRDLAERHRSIRAVFEHSWRGLTQDEQRVLERLSVFRGGFTRAAAQDVGGASLSHLSVFVAKSLMRSSKHRRYDLHELLRQFVFEKLSAPSLEEARLRHLDYFVNLAETAERELDGPRQIELLSQLEEEHDNFRAALSFALAQPADSAGLRDEALSLPAKGAQLAAALGLFWFIRGHHREGRRWMEQALAATQPESQPQARLHRWAGFFAELRRDDVAARHHLETAIRLSQRYGDALTEARAWHFLGLVAASQGKNDEDRAAQAKSAAIAEALGEGHLQALALVELGCCAMNDGDDVQAEALFREGIRHFTAMGDKNQLAAPVRRLGHIALLREDYAQALQHFRHSLALNVEVGDRRGMAACLLGVACVLGAQGRMVEAARLLGAEELLLTTVADSLLHADRDAFEAHAARIKLQLNDAAIAAAYAEGQRLTPEQAVALATAST